ncbi:MAG: GtrA family protein [Clostridia bacterium]|nr:GtrA family protein [Clostridia bacterium]
METKDNQEEKDLQENSQEITKKSSKKDEFIKICKFTAFSISAGVIQILSFELLYNWIGWHLWWPCYLISIILSVVWNFTFNRKFTFKSASNVPLAMTLALLFYCAFVPVSVFGGGALEAVGWNGTLVTLLMMVINFVLEFIWDKFVVFNDKVTNKLLSVFKKKKEKEED